MITAGLVTRDVDSADRRASVVVLTDAGRAQLTAWAQAHERRLGAALAALGDADRDTVRAALAGPAPDRGTPGRLRGVTVAAPPGRLILLLSWSSRR